MATTVSQHQQGAFTTPVNGTLSDAAEVLSNDNTLRTSYNAHDADTGVHVQSSALASRPAAGTAGRKWLTSDGLRVYYDNGATWDEIAYVPLVGGTMTGGLTISAGGITVTGNSTITGTLGGITTLTATTLAGTLSTAAQTNITSVGTLTGLSVSGGAINVVRTNTQLSLDYNGSNTCTFTVGSGGDLTIVPSGGDVNITGTLNATGLLTANAGLTVASGQTLTVTGATITGLTAASVAAGTFPSGTNTLQGHLLFTADNTYDIGASSATRPRTLYVGTSVNIGGVVIGTGAAILTTPASITFSFGGNTAGSVAPIRIAGTNAVSAPQTGDFWFDGTNLRFRDAGGTSRTLTWT